MNELERGTVTAIHKQNTLNATSGGGYFFFSNDESHQQGLWKGRYRKVRTLLTRYNFEENKEDR